MKKIVCIVMAAVMAVALFTGCAGKGEAKADTIKIGVLAPLTGAVAQYGNAVANGAIMYLDEVNAAGGVNGKQIEIIKYDEEGDSIKAVTGYNSLVDQGVTAIIGDVTTIPTVAVVTESQGDNMPMITASATAEKVTCQLDDAGNVVSVYENMFRSTVIDPYQGTKMANFVSSQLGAKTCAVLYASDDDYSVGLAGGFVKQAAAAGMTVVAEETFSKGSVDFTGQLTNIKEKNPDVLFIPYYYNELALIAKQAADVGVSCTLAGADGWNSVENVVTDISLLEGAYFCCGFSVEDEKAEVQTFVKNFTEKYGSAPDSFGAQGYDAAMILVAAIKAAEEKGLTAGSDEYKQAVIDTMNATDMDCITGHFTYNEFNNPELPMKINCFENGALKLWGQF